MTAKARELHLNVNMRAVGTHAAAWRLLDDPRAYLDGEFYAGVARIAERGTLDAIFLSDELALPKDFVSRTWQALDPIVLMAHLSSVTQHVGLVVTASTTYNHPFNLARRIGSLDHVSRGRAAVNLVTSWLPGASANFGLDTTPEKDLRYERAEEFAEVLFGLWDSWEDDALVGDRESGVFARGDKVHALEHVGKHFRVRGPSSLPRSPQGRPVVFQAGSSPRGRLLAARFADAVFTAQTTLEAGREFYAEIKNTARQRYGRDPNGILILPGLAPVVGSTEEEARRRQEEMKELSGQSASLAGLAATLGIPVEELHLDKPLPGDLLERQHATTRPRGFYEATVRLAYQENLTVRQILERDIGGHRRVVGTPEQIADAIEQWFVSHAADGFNVNYDAVSGLELFVDHVVPELRKRGIFRSEYRHTTLRERYGLAYPRSRFSAANSRTKEKNP